MNGIERQIVQCRDDGTDLSTSLGAHDRKTGTASSGSRTRQWITRDQSWCCVERRCSEGEAQVRLLELGIANCLHAEKPVRAPDCEVVFGLLYRPADLRVGSVDSHGDPGSPKGDRRYRPFIDRRTGSLCQGRSDCPGWRAYRFAWRAPARPRRRPGLRR